MLDRERRPSGARESAAQGGQQHPIARAELSPCDLAAQNLEFVPQDEDLEFLRALRARKEHDQFEDAAKREVDERPEHARPPRNRGEGGATDMPRSSPFDGWFGPVRVFAPYGLQETPANTGITLLSEAT